MRNAVLIIHGRPAAVRVPETEFAGELLSEAACSMPSAPAIVLPDAIGHGKSSKPSDGLKAHFPRYGYVDMVEAQHRLLTDGSA